MSIFMKNLTLRFGKKQKWLKTTKFLYASEQQVNNAK